MLQTFGREAMSIVKDLETMMIDGPAKEEFDDMKDSWKEIWDNKQAGPFMDFVAAVANSSWLNLE